MQSTKANKSKSQERSRAKSTVEGYHEGNMMEDKLLRKEIQFHMMICIITSPWWLATTDTMRDHTVNYLVQVDDTMDALDVMYN